MLMMTHGASLGEGSSKVKKGGKGNKTALGT
jgi:hypothetical protein